NKNETAEESRIKQSGHTVCGDTAPGEHVDQFDAQSGLRQVTKAPINQLPVPRTRMSDSKALYSFDDHDALSRVAQAGLLTGVIDGLFSSVLSVAFYNSTIQRLFQGVAATLLGAGAYQGGNRTFAIGVLMHFGVAFGWSVVFLLIVRRVTWTRRLLDSPYGVVKVA